MNIEAVIEEFAQGESRLHFVIGVSGLIMKELDNHSATVFCWDSEQAANEFISTRISQNQRKNYSVQSLNAKEFSELKKHIKWLPDNATVNLQFYRRQSYQA